MTMFSQLSPTNSSIIWQSVASLPIPVKTDVIRLFLQQYPKPDLTNISSDLMPEQSTKNENLQTKWLINLFNLVFFYLNVQLVHAEDENRAEPEYLPANGNQPAKICFAHGYFASALHEISHWTIAGKHRRTLADFGYWYAPDGRSEQQQCDFEKVEIKPQAIECLLTLACGRDFQISQDNLFADFDTADSTFAHDVYTLANHYLHEPDKLPRDARQLLSVLYYLRD